MDKPPSSAGVVPEPLTVDKTPSFEGDVPEPQIVDRPPSSEGDVPEPQTVDTTNTDLADKTGLLTNHDPLVDKSSSCIADVPMQPNYDTNTQQIVHKTNDVSTKRTRILPPLIPSPSGMTFRLMYSLEDLILKYFYYNFHGLDPYVLCNAHLKQRRTVKSLSALCRIQLEKCVPSTQIDKLLVQHDKNDARNKELNMDKILHNLAMKRPVSIVIPKLSKLTIDNWTKKRESWMDIDPYSSLEEVSDSDSNPSPKDTDSNAKVTTCITNV